MQLERHWCVWFLFKDESVKVLTDLGLSQLQAEIYLTLSVTGPATIRAVSKASNIARQDVYRLMPTLEKLGLAEKMLVTPAMYKATPIKDGCYLLLENKTKEHVELEKNTVDWVKKFQSDNFKTGSQNCESPFVVTSSKSLLVKKFDEKDKMAQKSIDAIVMWNFLRYRLCENLEDYVDALNRGIRVRMLTEKNEIDKSMHKVIDVLLANPLFEMRFLSEPFPIHLVIHDGLEVNLGVDNPLLTLGSQNMQFVKVMESYFEGLWSKAELVP